MSVTLDNLARELMCWFARESARSGKIWNDEGELIEEFANYLNQNSTIKAKKDLEVSELCNKSHLLLYRNEENTNQGVIAKFMIDGDKNQQELDEVVMNASTTLHNVNLTKNFQSTIKCIVSVYNDLHNRSKFHEFEFIEIYQQYGMGCAIKRLQ